MISHSGIAAPLMQSNLEVDQIASPILNSHLAHDPSLLSLKTHTHSESSMKQDHFSHAFYADKYLVDGSENKDFILNQEPYRNASVLLSGANFGIGSMQIMATTRLLECGFRVIIAKSFGSMFFDDSVSMGLLPIQLSPEIVNYLAGQIRESPETELIVYLKQQVIFRRGSEPIKFVMNDRVKNRFLDGPTDSDILATYAEKIEASKSSYLERRPWIK